MQKSPGDQGDSAVSAHVRRIEWDKRGLGTRTCFPGQHPQQGDWIPQRLRLDDLCGLFAVLIDDGDSFMAEEILNGLAGFVEDTHDSWRRGNAGRCGGIKLRED